MGIEAESNEGPEFSLSRIFHSPETEECDDALKYDSPGEDAIGKENNKLFSYIFMI